jgi:hypothetical protein
MYQQLRNNTCYNQFKSGLETPSEEHKRVYPFLNPEIVYNDVYKQYEYDAERCIIPNQTLSSFNISGDSCILKSSGKPTYFLKADNGCGIKVTDPLTYGSNMSKLQKSIDYDYLDKISKLEGDIARKQANIDNIQGNIDKKTVYMSALKRGNLIASEDIKILKAKKQDLLERQWPIIYKRYMMEKSTFEKEQGIYNGLVDKLSEYIDLVNNKEYTIMLFEDCWWGGYHPVLTLPKNQPSIKQEIVGYALSGVGMPSTKYIKVVLLDADEEKVELFQSIPCLVSVDFNDRAKTVVIERIDKEINKFEKQSDLGDTDEIKLNL